MQLCQATVPIPGNCRGRWPQLFASCSLRGLILPFALTATYRFPAAGADTQLSLFLGNTSAAATLLSGQVALPPGCSMRLTLSTYHTRLGLGNAFLTTQLTLGCGQQKSVVRLWHFSPSCRLPKYLTDRAYSLTVLLGKEALASSSLHFFLSHFPGCWHHWHHCPATYSSPWARLGCDKPPKPSSPVLWLERRRGTLHPPTPSPAPWWLTPMWRNTGISNGHSVCEGRTRYLLIAV